MNLRTVLLASLAASWIALCGIGVARFAGSSEMQAEATAMGFVTPVDFPVCRAEAKENSESFSAELARANKRMHQAMTEVIETGDPDSDFIQAMIPHHQGALDMARALLKFGRNERIKRLAQAIITEQAHEIAYMRLLLAQSKTTAGGIDRQ